MAVCCNSGPETVPNGPVTRTEVAQFGPRSRIECRAPQTTALPTSQKVLPMAEERLSDYAVAPLQGRRDGHETIPDLLDRDACGAVVRSCCGAKPQVTRRPSRWLKRYR